jgi:hypothetical protein
LDLAGRVVTADALHTQRDKNDYVDFPYVAQVCRVERAVTELASGKQRWEMRHRPLCQDSRLRRDPGLCDSVEKFYSLRSLSQFRPRDNGKNFLFLFFYLLCQLVTICLSILA